MTEHAATPREELHDRLEVEIAHFQGQLPERHAIAWRAYLAALLEWNVINIDDYDELVGLIPPVRDDPAAQILLGRD